MSDESRLEPKRPGSILCLGEAIVDLVCERPAGSVAEADSFVPHFGGALANVAVAAARAGAPVALAGGVGDDPWGTWLAERLRSEGVDLRWFSLVAGLQTPLAFVTFDAGGEPTFQIYGDGIDAGLHSVADRTGEAVDGASALVFGSNTLVGEPERELTLHARSLALAAGIPVVFDPNLRTNRWRGLDRALDLCRQATAGATLVRANLEEARLMTGAPPREPAGAVAERLADLGAGAAVVTLGREGAVVRGAAHGEARAPEVEIVSPMGAGDAFLGRLAAGLDRLGWEVARTAELLDEANEAGALACGSWGAVR